MNNTNLLFKWDRDNTFHRIFELDNDIIPNIGFAVLKTFPEKKFDFSSEANKEICLVLLSGKWLIKFPHFKKSYECQRTSVFTDRPTAFYIPPGTDFKLEAKTEGVIAFCESKANCDQSREIQIITPDKVKEVFHGEDGFQRKAYEIITHDMNAERLLVGETISKPGNWSSYPPHKHDIDNLPVESAQEELYFFQMHPADGFGFQRVYSHSNSLDKACLIEDGAVVAIPYGYHPVVSAPGVSHYYLWILAGEKRILKPSYDPKYIISQ